jgi:hypothetical protein
MPADRHGKALPDGQPRRAGGGILGAGGSSRVAPLAVAHSAKNTDTGADLPPEEWATMRDEWVDLPKKDIQAGSDCFRS